MKIGLLIFLGVEQVVATRFGLGKEVSFMLLNGDFAWISLSGFEKFEDWYVDTCCWYIEGERIDVPEW